MKSIKSLINLFYGITKYILTRQNNEASYQAFVKIYSITNGLSSYLFNLGYKVIDKINLFKKKKLKVKNS